MENFCYNTTCSAGVAHLVERHLAKVEVASSSLVTRSKNKVDTFASTLFFIVTGSNNKIQQSGGLLAMPAGRHRTFIF